MTDTDHYTGITLGIGKDAGTGFRVKPLAVVVIAGLAAVWASSFAWATRVRESSFWRRHGYLATLGLLVVFAYGGAVVRTTGGRMATLSLLLVAYAAYKHRQESKGAGGAAR
jgi:hypothetical protein